MLWDACQLLKCAALGTLIEDGEELRALLPADLWSSCPQRELGHGRRGTDNVQAIIGKNSPIIHIIRIDRCDPGDKCCGCVSGIVNPSSPELMLRGQHQGPQPDCQVLT
jgi:hypothetical protein